MKVLWSVEVRGEEAPRYHLARRDLGDNELAVGPLEAPALLGDFGVAGAAENGLVGGGLDRRPPRASHALRLDVVDLQVSGDATDFATRIGGD